MPKEKGIRYIFSIAVLLVLPVILVALAGRMVYIHYKMGEDLQRRGNFQQQAFRVLPAVRGTIFDRRGRILAGTKIVPSLFADPAMIEDNITLADDISSLLSLNSEEIINKIDKGSTSRFVWLARNISTETADALTLPGMRKKHPGIGIQFEPKRVYTAGDLAGHILGAVNIDGVGQEGVELLYNKTLRGQDGCERFVRDAAGRKIWLIKPQCTVPVNGQHIVLTIDAVVQQFTQKILAATCEQYKAESGVSVVLDPKTGDVLALASWPEVDPNKFGNTPPDKRRNRAITDPYEPGSIYKPFIASHGLDEKLVRLEDMFNCENGAWTVGRRTLHDAHAMGALSVADVVIHSSNIGMAKIGSRMGNDRLFHAVWSFGFGQKTGIDLPGEDPGIVIPLKRWTSFSTLSVPMGQEIAATSLQLVTAFAAIANKGVLLKPRLFAASINEEGEITRRQSGPIVRRQVISPETATIMVETVLRGVVMTGTGKRAEIPGYQVFGKTGTAQIARATSKGKGRYEDNAYVASFLGGAPASDPQVVAIVSIRRPDKRIGHYGGTVSAPAVKQIIQSYFEYLRVGPFESVDNATKTGEEEKGDVGF